VHRISSFKEYHIVGAERVKKESTSPVVIP
jgi:hypothetical protein